MIFLTINLNIADLNVPSSHWALYIGLKDLIGLNVNYTWVVDNTTANFVQFEGIQPNNPYDCCVLVVANPFYGGWIGTWDDMSCTYNSGAICESDQVR